MPIRFLLFILALALVGAACETGQVDRGRFDAMVEERDAANRRLIDAVQEADELRRQLDELSETFDETQMTAPLMGDTEWEALLSAYDLAWNAMDPEGLETFYTEDAVVELALEGIVRRGRDSIGEFFSEFLAGYESYNQESEVFRADGNSVVFLWEASARRTDGSLALFAGGTFFEVEESGLIARQVDYAVFD